MLTETDKTQPPSSAPTHSRCGVSRQKPRTHSLRAHESRVRRSQRKYNSGMPSGSVRIGRSVAIQLGTAALISDTTLCLGGHIAPLAMAVLGERMVRLLGNAASVLIPNLLVGPIARFAHRKEEDARQRSEREQNHHVQRAINRAIARCMTESADTYTGSRVVERFLRKVGRAIEKDPLRFEVSETSGGAVDEKRVTELLSGNLAGARVHPPLKADEWKTIIDLASLDQIGPSWGMHPERPTVVEHAAAHLEANFSTALVATMKEMGAENDLAWFALVMRFLSEIHEGVRENRTAVAEVAEVAEVAAIIESQAAETRKAFERLTAGVVVHDGLGAARPESGAAGSAQEQRDHLQFIHEVAAALSADIPLLRCAAGLTVELLPGIADNVATAAEATREMRELLDSHGLVPLVANNVPPVPRTFVERKTPLARLARAIWGNEAGRVQLVAGGGTGKTVLARHYASAFRGRYPGGVFTVACEERTLAEALDQLMPPHDAVKGLATDARAAIVRAKLTGERRSLLILDNVHDAVQWATYRDDPLLPTPPCHLLITTQAQDIDDLVRMEVGHLEVDEAIELLSNFRPSARRREHRKAIVSILRDTELLAVLVAAVGAAMAEDRNDNWEEYAHWLTSTRLEKLPDSQGFFAHFTDYPRATVGILDDLRHRIKKLHPGTLRALDYASLLPADMIPTAWLERLLAADADSTRGPDGLDLGKDTRGRPRRPEWHIERLKEYDLLRQASADGSLWSLHRLHGRRALEVIESDAASMRTMIKSILHFASGRWSWLTWRGRNNPARWQMAENRWELRPLLALMRRCPMLSVDDADSSVNPSTSAQSRFSTRYLTKVESELKEMLRIYRHVGDHADVATVLGFLALMRLTRRQFAEARSYFEEAFATTQRYPEGAGRGDWVATAESLFEKALAMTARASRDGTDDVWPREATPLLDEV